MSQADPWGVPRTSSDGTITGGKYDPEQHFTRLDNVLDAILSSHVGTASGEERPSYAVAGTVWRSQSTGQLYLYDGSSDLEIAVNVGAPASASDTGVTGQVAWDTDYFYICTATDTWKRVAVATW